MDYSKNFGRNIRIEREKRNFSQELVASIVGITAQELDDIENGNFEEVTNEIIELTNLFSLSFNDAVFGDSSDTAKEEAEKRRKEKIKFILSHDKDVINYAIIEYYKMKYGTSASRPEDDDGIIKDIQGYGDDIMGTDR